MIDKFITVLFIQTVFTQDKFCWRDVCGAASVGENKLDEWKALVDILGIKSADLEDKFLF